MEKENWHCACWDREATGQQAQPAGRPSRASAPRTCPPSQFKPDGRGPQVREREGHGKEGEDDRRGPPVITNPWTGGSRRSPAMMQATASSGECGDGFSVESPFGWRWCGSPEWSGLPATRSAAEELREVATPAVPDCKERGRERGNDQR